MSTSLRRAGFGLALLAASVSCAWAGDAVFAYSHGDDSVLLTNLQEVGRTALFTIALYRDDDAAGRLRVAGARMTPPDIARLVDAVAPDSGVANVIPLRKHGRRHGLGQQVQGEH